MAQAGFQMQSLQDQLLDLKSKYSETLSKERALDFALEAAELHMKFLRIATSKKDKTELGKKCKSLLDEAARIKTSDIWEPEDDLLIDFKPLEVQPATTSKTSKLAISTRDDATPPGSSVGAQSPIATKPKPLRIPLSARQLEKSEEILLLKSSKINGCIFPPFQQSSKLEDFDAKTSKAIYIDPFDFRMSKDQLELLDRWKRPSESLPPPDWSTDMTSGETENAPLNFMKASKSVDLVQDAATDCSIVASLSAAITRAERGFADVLSTAIYPFDEIHGCPGISPTGKYMIRLNFNGCSRQVVIDDRLPVSKSSRVLHVVDRNNPALLWPALLEKAYLKIRGGYDFPGSNSGTDLYALTGWIPEQIFLQHEETSAEKLWSRMRSAFDYGDVLITMGTGVMTPESERALGLAGEHDYAVIDIDDTFGQKRMLIKNPWLRATAWKGYHVRPTDIGSDAAKVKTEDIEEDLLKLDSASWTTTSSEDTKLVETFSSASSTTHVNSGAFWIDMSDVMQNFDSIYLNWNPGLFKHRQDLHFSWDLTEGPTNARSCPSSFINNPQLSISGTEVESVWLLLSKHFTDKPSNNASRGSLGYINLYAFMNQGFRVLLSKGAAKQGLYVDSPQTLLPIDIDPQKPHTVVVSEQDLPPTIHIFTMSVFSQHPVKMSLAMPRLPQQTSVRSSWTSASAGGNVSSERYSSNPQFALKLDSTSTVCLTLETLTPGLSVHIKLLFGQGHRVYSVTNRDIVIDSGDYRRGYAVAETKVSINAGVYTIVCSTFEAGQLGDFTLRVSANTEVTLTPIVKEGAGRVRHRLADASFGAGVHILASPMNPRRLASLNFTAKYLPVVSSTASPDERHKAMLASHSPIRLTVELGRGPTRQILIASGDGMFSDLPSGVRTTDINLQPGMNRKIDMWLMLERLGGFEGVGRSEERVAIDMWADVGQAVDFGVWREWER